MGARRVREWTMVVALGLCAGLAVARDIGSVEVDALFANWNKPGSPGCAVGIFENGRAIYTRGYGLADLDHGIPNTPDTVFFIGSMGKQFTAACILLLAEEGKLSLDDDVRKYIPELHEFGKVITIRQLLHHTSGLRDFLNLALQAGHIEATFTDVAWLTDKSVLDMTAHQTALNFPPGSDMSYSNTGYFLLSVICQRLTKKNAPDLAVERLAKPLGMDSTFAVLDARRTIPGRAYGYVPDGLGYRSVAVAYGAPGPAGLWTTVNDLGKWGWALMSDRIGRPGIAAKMEEPGVLDGGKRIPYAAGLMMGKHRGLRMVSHGGGYPGFTCDMVHFPDYGYSFVCLANAPTGSPTAKCIAMAELYLGRLMEPVKKPAEAPKGGAEACPFPLKNLEGEYRLDQAPVSFIITVEGESVFLAQGPAKIKLKHAGGVRFRVEEAGADLEFIAGDDGKVNGLKGAQAGMQLTGKRVTRVTPPPERLAELVGRYTSPELDATYRVLLEDGKLRGRTPRGDTRDMIPGVDADHWGLPIGPLELEIVFVRGDNGRVTGLLISDSRANNVVYERE